MARRSHHSRSTHFIPAGGPAGRPDLGDRNLGPVSGPESATARPVPHTGVRGTRSQIRGCFWGPKSGPQIQGSQGGVRQRFSCPVSQSSPSYCCASRFSASIWGPFSGPVFEDPSFQNYTCLCFAARHFAVSFKRTNHWFSWYSVPCLPPYSSFNATRKPAENGVARSKKFLQKPCPPRKSSV